MSLKQIADELAARGRYGDSELVHMSKGEVAGLQSLAQAAGGSLTINPDTGKPEAFFLAALLPTLLGAAAPALGAAATGAGMAGLGGLLSGKFGAMGLGALAGGLMNKKDPLMGAITGGMGGMGGAGLAKGFGLGGAGAGAAGATGQGVTGAALGGAGQSGLGLSAGAGEGLRLAGAGAGAPGLQATASNIGTQMAAKGAPMAFSGAAAPMTTAEMLKSGAMAAAPMMDAMSRPRPMREEEPGEIPEYDYTSELTGDYYQPGQGTHERRYFTEPRFTRRAAAGGSIGYANGGQLNIQGSLNLSEGQGGQDFNGYSPAGSGFTSGQQAQPTQMQNPVLGNQTSQPMGGLGGYGAIGNSGGGFAQSQSDSFSQQLAMLNRAQPQAPLPQNNFNQQQGHRQGVVEMFNTGTQTAQPLGTLFSEGGLAALAKGGMREGGFVVPADVVSMVGEGNTDAGYERIKRMLPGATPIKGKDGGQADTVKTSIEGAQPARVAHGEMYVPPATVNRAGGAKKLYAMMDKVREQATGNKKQIKPVNIKKALA